jgi:RNA polymerase sigma factor (TIGR02999 family)
MENLVTDRVTRLVEGVQHAEGRGPEELVPFVYDQLKELARQYMGRERKDHTLGTTALVHEAYLRLLGQNDPQWAGRTHFVNAAAEAMRRILIEHARSRGQVKRGGRLKRLPLEAVELASQEQAEHVIPVDEAVTRLEEFSPSVGSVLRLRFYAGLTQKETAEALGISERTVRREWLYGRAWLMRELSHALPG